MNLKKPALILTAIVCCGALLAACSSDDSSSDGVKVSDAWTRITAPTAKMGAVYVNLESGEDDRLIKAAVPTDIAGKTEIHETVTSEADIGSTMEGDTMGGDSPGESAAGGMGSDAMMGMRPIDGLDLPAGESVSLEPGGYHIMLFELKKPIAAGDTIPVTLTFEKAGEVKVDAEAREG